jgi:hypothetical protein
VARFSDRASSRRSLASASLRAVAPSACRMTLRSSSTVGWAWPSRPRARCG